IEVASLQGLIHQIAEPSPGHDDLDDKRPAERRANDDAVDRQHRLQREKKRVAPDDVRMRNAARTCREDAGIGERLANRPGLQALEPGCDWKGERERRKKEVARNDEYRFDETASLRHIGQ